MTPDQYVAPDYAYATGYGDGAVLPSCTGACTRTEQEIADGYRKEAAMFSDAAARAEDENPSIASTLRRTASNLRDAAIAVEREHRGLPPLERA